MSIEREPSPTPSAIEQEHEREQEAHIALGDSVQVTHWANKLGVTPERLREALAEVGPRVADIRRRLAQPELAD